LRVSNATLPASLRRFPSTTPADSRPFFGNQDSVDFFSVFFPTDVDYSETGGVASMVLMPGNIRVSDDDLRVFAAN
jgi:hypothetical protein